MRLVYLGTSDFAAVVLRRLAECPHQPALVVTPPDRRRGRGRRLAPPPTAAAARELGLDLHQTESINLPESLERIRGARPDAGVVCAFGQLIAEPLLSELDFLNVHPSLLPRWRGAAPIERAIMAGDAETGVSVMRVVESLDAGPVALREAVPIDPREDYGGLSERLAELGGDLIVRALDLHARGKLEFTPQDDSRATYAEKVSPHERRLDPTRPAEELERVVRGLSPHIGAYVALDGGGRLGVRTAAAEQGELAPGELASDGRVLRLGCASGVLRIHAVQPPGRRPMATDAYLRGHGVPSLAS